MNTVYWPLSWAVIIFIGAVLLLVVWWLISEYGASKYVQGRDNALQGTESWRRQIEGHKQMANAAWARSFTWYHEVIKLNKAQRRLHRKLARFEKPVGDVDDPRSPWHNVWERGYLSGWRDCLNEYGKTWQQVQAQAPQQAVEQGPPGQGQEQGVTLRPARDPASAPPEKVQGQEEGQAHDHG